MQIRTARADDATAVAAVCLATAAAGEPVPPDAPHADLIPAVYARPYLALEPQTARLLVPHDPPTEVLGYVVGALDSGAFYARWRREWTPRFPSPPRPLPDGPAGQLWPLLADPERAMPPVPAGFPSHLHINLLPSARGGGWGRRLLTEFLTGLAAAGSPGVHLGVDPANRAAGRFYTALGFRRLDAPSGSPPGTDLWVRRLVPGPGTGQPSAGQPLTGGG